MGIISFLTENFYSILVGLALLVIVFLVIRKMILDKKAGRSSCSGCSGCGSSGGCDYSSALTKEEILNAVKSKANEHPAKAK